MIDWLTIVIALVIIATLVGFFGFLAWKINMSDPLANDDSNQHSDVTSEKKKKEKTLVDQGKKKRKDQKKPKRDAKDEEQVRTKAKGTTVQASEETDDEQEESEQELVNLQQSQTAENSSKARKRNKNKTPLTQVEANVKSATARAPPVTHPKSTTTKNEVETNKQQTKGQKQPQSTTTNNKPTMATTTTKKSAEVIEDHEPFTVVGGNRHKSTAAPLQQQQNKPHANPATPTVVPVQQSSPASVQRQQPTQKPTIVQVNTPTATTSLPPKQQQQQTKATPPTAKVADLIKALPSSQLAVTELMCALDAYPLSTDELDIIMQKIANKQLLVKQDWSKLQLGQKIDPKSHIGQVMDESAKAYADDMKTNSMKRVKELTDELNAEKRRNHDLLKEKTDKERENQILHAQLDSVSHKSTPSQGATQPQQQKLQTLEMQVKRLTEENAQLQQQLTTTNTGDSNNLKFQLLSEQVKKLSMDNANWEKKAHSNDLLAKEAQKEKEDLLRYNEQLTRLLQESEKELKSVEEKFHRQSNDQEVDELKSRITQLESENEQLRREDIVHVEPSSPTHVQTFTVSTEEREQFEKEIQQLKQTIESKQEQEREFENTIQTLTKEIEELKKEINLQQQTNESHNQESNALRNEVEQLKSTVAKSEENLHQEREKLRKMLTDLLTEDLRIQLPQDNQDSDHWFSTYRQLVETNKHNMQEECAGLKRENDQLQRNMNDIENQLKEIEKTVQNKEESLLSELKDKESVVETVRNENEHLTGEIQRLRNEIQQLQSMHDASTNEVCALKHQLDEKLLLATNSPAVIADESFELVKQPSPSLSPIVIDIRAEQLNELIRSSKEALENQDSITQQLDKHLNDIHPSGQGETSTSVASSDTNQ
ncbi:unnamed protein product [Adineta ricciae]|uniref:Uncharacterized protein n=1 Tax=Adineta ricciae TaxID=249248 RepID=A0A815HHM4_ADIRI|nr:unnamed protein product [Adineta ricciae]CAF1352678.1 unnamed protein product [Adineta ricciae]